MQSKEVEKLVNKLEQYKKEWGVYPRLDFCINGEQIHPHNVNPFYFSSKCTVELDLQLDEDEVKFLQYAIKA